MSLRNDVYNYCISCTKYACNRQNSKGYGYCHDKNEYYDPFSGCRSYSENTSLSLNDLKSFKNNYICKDLYKKYEGTNCYITTIMVNILGLDDNDKTLETLRTFRNNILKTNSEYLPILAEYDNIGPIIASKINEDESKEQIALTMYHGFLLPTVSLINDGLYAEAIKRYTEMVEFFISYYTINTNYNIDEYQESTPVELRGHARVLQPIKKEVLTK